jgi:hypothetical protein
MIFKVGGGGGSFMISVRKVRENFYPILYPETLKCTTISGYQLCKYHYID